MEVWLQSSGRWWWKPTPGTGGWSAGCGRAHRPEQLSQAQGGEDLRAPIGEPVGQDFLRVANAQPHRVLVHAEPGRGARLGAGGEPGQQGFPGAQGPFVVRGQLAEFVADELTRGGFVAEHEHFQAYLGEPHDVAETVEPPP